MDKQASEPFFKTLAIALKMLAGMTLLTGVLYPVFVMLISHAVFPEQSSGSIIKIDGVPRGSKLIGQNFTSEKYFWPRPSSSNYATMPASASNLGPTSSDLKNRVKELKAKWEKFGKEVPSELLYTSGSGLDPHLTEKGIEIQFERVVKARNLSEEKKSKLKSLIASYSGSNSLKFLNGGVINVLELNLALDEMDPHESH